MVSKKKGQGLNVETTRCHVERSKITSNGIWPMREIALPVLEKVEHL